MEKVLEYVRVNIEDLELNEKNSREHTKASLDATRKSLVEFGQVKPIVIDKDNKVWCGNGTVKCAMELEWEKINAVVLELDEEGKIAYAIADNRTGDLSEWQYDNLSELVTELNDTEFDLDMLGFTKNELEGFLNYEDVDEDAKKEDIKEAVEENKPYKFSVTLTELERDNLFEAFNKIDEDCKGSISNNLNLIADYFLENYEE